ncbi:MAG: VWA domain-containing protein [Deltaproteobacteria bacterium]|nr:VWA domain-containing protein [Deltaproteobacteria bacterium]
MSSTSARPLITDAGLTRPRLTGHLESMCIRSGKSPHAGTAHILGILVMMFLFFPGRLFAGGVLHVFPPQLGTDVFPVARLAVHTSRALITVHDSSVEYRIDQTFFNDNQFPLKGIYLLPVEDEVSAVAEVQVDGVTSPFRITGPDAFFGRLKELSREMKDSSLLGLAGKRLLVVDPITLGISQQRTVRIRYAKKISASDDVLEIALPLDGERFSLGPVGLLNIRVRFALSRPVRTVISPSHHIVIHREATHRCLVQMEAREQPVRDDFRLLATFSGDQLNVRLFTHRQPNREGFFMALIESPAMPERASEPEKDVVFLLDTSGSLGDKAFGMAKDAVVYCLDRLRPRDRFNVITTGTRVSALTKGLVAATEANISDAVRFVDTLPSGGGTDLYGGLMSAMDQFTGRKRPSFIMLTGDGKATVGITDPASILDDVKRQNKVDARIFALAFGTHAEIALLDKLTVAAKGKLFHVGAREAFDSQLQNFFAAISRPPISAISMQFQEVKTEQVIPVRIPDPFREETVFVFGRYSTSKETQSQVRLTAKTAGGAVVTVGRPATFPLAAQARPYIASLWGMRKLAELLEQYHLTGSEAPVADEIGLLAKQFGLRNPLLPTSAGADRPGPPYLKSGSLLWTLKTSLVPADIYSGSYRVIGGKVFRSEQGQWIDTSYDPTMKTIAVDFLGDVYFELLRKEPHLGPWLVLGPRVTLVRGEEALSVRQEP